MALDTSNVNLTWNILYIYIAIFTIIFFYKLNKAAILSINIFYDFNFLDYNYIRLVVYSCKTIIHFKFFLYLFDLKYSQTLLLGEEGTPLESAKQMKPGYRKDRKAEEIPYIRLVPLDDSRCLSQVLKLTFSLNLAVAIILVCDRIGKVLYCI